MKKISLTILFALVLLLPLISAEDIRELPAIKQGTCMPLVQYCATCTYVNITSMTYPNGSVQALNWQTQKIGADTYVNNSFCNTGQLGDYVYGTMGNPDGVTTSQSVMREVTNAPSGYRDTLGFYFIIIALITLVTIMGFFIKEAWFVVIGGMALIIFGLYTINYGVAGIRDMNITWAIALFEIAVGAILAIGAGMDKMDNA